VNNGVEISRRVVRLLIKATDLCREQTNPIPVCFPSLQFALQLQQLFANESFISKHSSNAVLAAPFNNEPF